MLRPGYVYLLTTASNTAIYTGVTSDLQRRLPEHKNNANPGCFTAKYNCNKLVYWNQFRTIEEAIAEEKRIKGSSRKKKEALINSLNPNWQDLWGQIDRFR